MHKTQLAHLLRLTRSMATTLSAIDARRAFIAGAACSSRSTKCTCRCCIIRFRVAVLSNSDSATNSHADMQQHLDYCLSLPLLLDIVQTCMGPNAIVLQAARSALPPNAGGRSSGVSRPSAAIRTTQSI